MGLDSMLGILPQTPMALLVVKEEVSSTQAIHFHMFQLPKNQITLQYMHNHPCVPRKCGGIGRPGWSTIITSSIMAYSSAGVSPVPSPTSASALDNLCMENHGVSSNDVYSPWSSGEYISPESSCLSKSITGTQQLLALLTKANTIITFEGSRLQPGDVLDAYYLHALGTSHMWVSGDRVKPDERVNKRPESPHQGISRPFIIKGHVTNAHVVP